MVQWTTPFTIGITMTIQNSEDITHPSSGHNYLLSPINLFKKILCFSNFTQFYLYVTHLDMFPYGIDFFCLTSHLMHVLCCIILETYRLVSGFHMFNFLFSFFHLWNPNIHSIFMEN
jgi:hypothetical protein